VYECILRAGYTLLGLLENTQLNYTVDFNAIFVILFGKKFAINVW